MLHQPATTAAPYTREVATRPGQRGMLTLVDGSTVKLDGATRVRIDYGAGRRTAELLAGQASFDIRHDSVRPFIVGAGSGEIRVLGTAFDLDLTGHRLKLAVYRGAVRFGSVAGQTRSVLVRAGYRSSLHDGAVADPERFDTTLPTWWGGWIDTNGMRLDEVVEVLNRQAGVSIAAPPEALSAVRVSGRFRIDRPAQILRAMGDGFGFTVVERNGKLVLRPNA
ncbi:FecR family protein [Sphingomonas guangdongensis]|nr:FecR domain-containing protein [Sphingomonas guangdongensis]